MSIQRISVANISVDICRAEDIESEVLELLAKPGTKQIVFLSVWDLLRARGKSEYATPRGAKADIFALYEAAYKDEPFVRVLAPGEQPMPVKYK